MTDHQHIQMLIDRVDCERACRIGRGRQHIWLTAHAQNIGSVTAARAFGMEGMNHPILKRTNRGFNEARFIQGVGMDRDLHIQLISHCQAVVNRTRRRAPIFV